MNPDHLFLGTQQENIDDMIQKNRHRHGETHHLAKLTDEQLEAIKDDSRKQRLIAQEYGISQAQVSRIKLQQRRHG